ncbi:ADP-ribosylglycohydrolase family protein [Sphaerisporangium siamense]|nr:ADP-ribosylglycohydrolase family protein [Sphaerisporangium siamense]
MVGGLEFGSRVRGCLIGGAVGDALGAPIEFDSIAGIRAVHGQDGIADFVHDRRGRVGLITDDTQMTLFTVEGLIRAGVRAAAGEPDGEVSVVRDAYLRWLDTQRYGSPPPADGRVRSGRLREQEWLYDQRAPGNACLSGLRQDLGATAAPGAAGAVNPDSKGCGTVMRSAPFGLAFRDPRRAFELAAACAQITHGHPTGYLAAGAFAALVSSVAYGGTLAGAVRDALALLSEQPSNGETTAALDAAVELAAEGNPTPETVERLGGAWVAEEALAIAVYCALVHEDDAERALLLAVNHSGDSDSTGAVCGNILGALHGEAAVPRRWVSRLEGRDTITALADDLTAWLTTGHADPDAYPGF